MAIENDILRLKQGKYLSANICPVFFYGKIGMWQTYKDLQRMI